jgi:multiple sugar transport system substrate-binding protein
MKKVLVLLVLLIIAIPLTFFSARGNFFGEDPNAPVTLSYWGVEQDESFIKPLIDKYKQAHPNVTVQYRQLSLNKYRETIEARIRENKGPDIFRFHSSWVPMLKEELAPVPSNIMDDKLAKTVFYPIVSQDLRVNNKLVGIPLEFDGLALIYNTALFGNAGYNSPPTDWFAFRQMAQKLTSRASNGQIAVAGAALGTSNNVDYHSDILGLMFLQNGTKMITQKQVTFDKTIVEGNNLGADALAFYTNFVKTDKVWDRTLPSSIQAFSQGKVAMIFAPASKIPDIIRATKTANPQVPFKVAAVPQLPDREPVTWGSFWVEGVNAKSRHQKAAWEFISYLNTPEALKERFNLMSGRDSLGMPYSRVDMKTDLSANPYLNAFGEMGPSAQSWYLASNTFDTGLNDRLIVEFSKAIDAMQSTNSADTALKNISKSVIEILTGYGLATAPTPTP